MNRPRKRKYPTDTEAGIRTITQIRGLPSIELTDEEFCKAFFDRFEAKALLMVYFDKDGIGTTFGRLKYGAEPGEWYRRLLSIWDSVVEKANCKIIEDEDI